MKIRSKRRRGAAMVEYALLVAGVSLICMASVSVLGHKTNDLVAAIASVLPGAHPNDNGAIDSGQLVETTIAATTNTDGIGIDTGAILGNSTKNRLNLNTFGPGASDWATIVLNPPTGPAP
jgi:Flp pilus assembly pilin Flp